MRRNHDILFYFHRYHDIFYLSSCSRYPTEKKNKKTPCNRNAYLCCWLCCGKCSLCCLCNFFSGASLLDPVLTTALINALAVIILFLSSMMAAESAERAFAFEIFLSSIIVVFSFIIFDDMSLARGGAFVFVLATLHFLGRVGANIIILTRKM